MVNPWLWALLIPVAAATAVFLLVVLYCLLLAAVDRSGLVAGAWWHGAKDRVE